jgi:hypothetical protein
MDKVKNIFKSVQSALTLIFFRLYDKHFTTIADFETSGEVVGEKLSQCVSGAVDVVGQSYPEEYKHRLRDAVRRGFNR